MSFINNYIFQIQHKSYEYIFAYFASAALIKDPNFIKFFNKNGNKKTRINLDLGTINESADFELATLTIYEHLTDKNLFIKIKHFPIFGRKKFLYNIIENIRTISPKKYNLLKFLLDDNLFSFWKKSIKNNYDSLRQKS